MIKEFTYKIGDSVWLMYEDKAICRPITKAWYSKHISCADFESVSDNESYYVCISTNSRTGNKFELSFELKDLFKTKEDLINSL